MEINAPSIFISLARYGNLAEEEYKAAGKARYIFQRVVENNQEELKLTTIKELGLWSRIKLWFGHSDFRLRTISRLINTALSVDDRRLSKMLTSEDKLLKESLFSKSGDMLSGLIRFNEKVKHQAEKPIGCIGRLFKKRGADHICDEMANKIFMFSLGDDTLPVSGDWREKVPEEWKKFADEVYQLTQDGKTISDDDMRNLVEKARGISLRFGPMSLGMLQAFVNWVKNVTSNLDPVSPKVSKLSDKKQDKKEQEHLEELAEKIKEMPSIDGKALRGLYNPSCTCYRNALIKAFAVSPAFEKALNESDLAQAFVDLSKALKEGGETIQQEDGVLLLFNALLQQHFPQLKKTYNQQDIQELMMPFLEEMLTQPSFKIKEVVERAPESWRYHMWRVWYGLPKDLPIPSLAVKGEAEDQKNIFFKMPIHGKQPFSIEQVFTGRKNMVDVTVNNILASERVSNNKKVELAPLLHKAADSKGNLYPVVVREKVQLEGEPPACLPIYVPRFTEELRKNSARVKFPFFLQVPHTKGIKETYVLRSVAVHRGTARNSGHYVTYIPDPTTFDIKTKMPLEWTEHSDSSVKPCTWNTIKDEIETNGCIFVYDRLTE